MALQKCLLKLKLNHLKSKKKYYFVIFWQTEIISDKLLKLSACFPHRTHSGRQPILVFDVCSLVALLCNDTAEMLCGGRHLMYQERLNRLFTQLSAIAELIFFQDGPVGDNKYRTWAARQHETYNKHLKIIDMIYEGHSVNSIVSQNSIYNNTVLNVIEESCKKFGRLYFSVNHECDQEAAQFCYMNLRVLGVFSNDTDYLIFPGHYRYFSTKDIDIETLTTKEFNRSLLKDTLGLTNFQMKIFATLAGNDIVRFDHEDLKYFHKKFSEPVKTKLPEIASYVKKITHRCASHRLIIKVLSEKICGKPNNETLQQLLNASIVSYDVKSEKSDIELNENNQWSFLLRNHHLFTYSILNKLPINFSLVLFDLRWKDMPSYFDMCAPMFERQAGIVYSLTSMPLSELTVYTKISQEKDYGNIQLWPFFPPFSLPSLVELYSNDLAFDELRYNLLKWCINWNQLQFYNLLVIPPNLMISVLTVHFMSLECAISPKEADIILWTVKNAENGTIPLDLKPPRVLHPRAFRIAVLFVKLYANTARCIEVCGLKNRYSVSVKYRHCFKYFHQLSFQFFSNRSTSTEFSSTTSTSDSCAKTLTRTFSIFNFNKNFFSFSCQFKCLSNLFQITIWLQSINNFNGISWEE